MSVCYAFEAKSIQAYVLNSGKLKDMVGASEIVDQLTGEPLQEAMKAVGIGENEIQFSRRAGGSFIAFMDDDGKAEALRDVWSLVVAQFAPGLDFVHMVTQAASEREAAALALKELQSMRFPSADIPSASPLTRYNPRTGIPAAKLERSSNGNEWVDAATTRRRMKKFRQGHQLSRKLSDTELNWPVNMEKEFPHLSGNSYIGIIHADGNGLGKILRALQKTVGGNYREVYSAFSGKLEKATCDAAKKATQSVLVPAVSKGSFMPARPLVLGGDDLTMIVRGDLALSFTRSFLDAFEESTKDLCSYLRGKDVDWPQKFLTSCAGIAYIKSGQPFAMGYALAEELCSLSKEKSERRASSLSFHRVSTSFIPDAEWVRDQEMSSCSGNTTFVGTMGSYRVGSASSDLPALADLLALGEIIGTSGNRSGAGLMRRLLGIMHEPFQVAKDMYARWRDLLLDKETGAPDFLKEFDNALSELLGEGVTKELPAQLVKSGDHKVYESPLGDILALKSVGSIGDMS